MIAALSLLLATSEPITRVAVNEKVIALTFDACQTKKPSGYDAKIIQILQEKKARATLFLGGAWSETHSNQARVLGQNPLFEIAQHSYLHPHFPQLSLKQQAADLEHAQEAIKKATGKTPRLFRPPSGEYTADTLKIARKAGLITVLWSLVTGDPDKNVSAKEIVRTVLTRAKAGDIVIMHMNGRGWHTAEALPQVIDGLRKKGFRLVQVSEMLAAGRKY